MANIDIFPDNDLHPLQRRAAREGWRSVPRQQKIVLKSFFSVVAAMADLAAVLIAATAFAQVWHALRYMSDVPRPMIQMSLAIALFVLVPNMIGGHYVLASYMTFKGRLRRLFRLWNIAFFAALALAFLTKTTDQLSRAAVAALYVGGFVSLVAARLGLVTLVQSQNRRDVLARRRIVLVGGEDNIHNFMDRHDMRAHGFDIVAAAILRDGDETLSDDLALAVASARMMRPDDIVILLPWSQKRRIEACADAFLRLPAALHLGPESVLDRFEHVEISRLGPAPGLALARSPMSHVEILAKRALDAMLASLALIALAPLFALVAAAIKLDSKGPVFFAQRRYGFNQEPFRIFKFRSMTTMEDGRHVQQCRENDARLTRVGAFIRRWNIDELPQLVNVLLGDMSLVGPRPHAMTHDQAFCEKIALYARRHNVRPGITGWAQVNGFRGVTDTDDKMRRRVEHDLYYIDNWSIFFDLRILARTILSPKAYRNAR